MNLNYATASLRELAILAAILYGLNLGVEFVFDVNILARAGHDFKSLPVPKWTWPTWLVSLLIFAAILLEIVFRVHSAVIKRLTA